MDKVEDCSMCICINCYEEHGLDPDLCKYSDCQWCQNEKGQWTERCSKYLEKGGTYGEKPKEGDFQ